MVNATLDISALASNKLTGIGNYVFHLATALKEIPDLHLSGTFKISRWKGYTALKANSTINIGFPYIPIIYPLLSNKSQIFHGPDFWIPEEIKQKKVLTIHDLSIFQSDLWPKDRLERSVSIFSNVLRKSHLDQVIVVSDFVKKEVEQRFPFLEGKITRVYHGVDHFPEQLAETIPAYPFPYIFYMGTIEKRKNLETLYHAFQQLETAFPDLHLVVAGGNGGYLGKEIQEKIIQQDTRNKVIFTGYIDQQRQRTLLKQAELMVYPSLYEGFGFPILEAMRIGTAVVTSDIGAMAEIAGNAAQLVDSNHSGAIAKGIKHVLEQSDLKSALIERGKHRAKEFTWKKCADETFTVYKNALNG